MRINKAFLLLFLLTGFLLHGTAQSIELHALVTLNDGQEQSFYLTEEDQLGFEGQETLIIHSEGSSVTFNIDDIRKIEFVDVTSTEEHKTTPLFFPNPVRKSIIFGYIGNGQLVSIYSADGRLLRQFQVNANEQLDLSDLPAGLYIMNLCEKNYKLLKL